MNRARAVVLGLTVGLAIAAVGSVLFPVPTQIRDEPLYFSLEVRQGGHVVARPQLVGLSGHPVREHLRARSGAPRLELQLIPTLTAATVQLALQLDLPGEAGLQQRLTLVHGEQKTLTLSPDVEVSVLAMKVRTPEFEAFIRASPALDDAAGDAAGGVNDR
jgi:hypothetical protein